MERKCAIDTEHGAVRSVRFNKDGNYMLTCGSDKTIKLWNPSRGLLIKTYKKFVTVAVGVALLLLLVLVLRS